MKMPHFAQNKKFWIYTGVSVFLLLIALIVFCYWLIYGRFYVRTDDAYVQGNQVRLTSQIPGIVTQINTDFTKLVEEGQILIELDPTDNKLNFAKSLSVLAQTIRDVSQMFETTYQLAADLEGARADLFKAEIYYIDRQSLKDTGAISLEDYITAEINFFSARARFESLEFALMKAITAVKGTTVKTHPLVQKAVEDVKTEWVALERCKIRAPATGIVAQRNVQVGSSVSPEDPLLAIVPMDQIWVNGNFKEVQLEKIRLGQPVELVSDTYGKSHVYKGEVIGIEAGTGAAFSVLPPQNATGNWIKIVQRVPVRIKLNQEDLIDYPLRIGLTMNVAIDIRDQSGPRVPTISEMKRSYGTDVFQDQEMGVQAVIDKIIAENLPFEFPPI